MNQKRVLTVAITLAAAFCVFNATYVDEAEAFVCGGLCIAGIAIAAAAIGGYIGATFFNDDDNNPNGLSEESVHHAAMEDKITNYVNLYNRTHVELSNLQMLYENTYLACVRYAENEASEVVQYATWDEAKSHMDTFNQFNSTARSILLNIMGSYGYMDAQILDTVSDSDNFAFCTVKQDGSNQNYIDWGVQLVNNTRSGSYVGEYFLNFIGVPPGESVTVDNTTYEATSDYKIFQFASGDLDDVFDGCFNSYTINSISDESKVYVNGVRTDYPVFSSTGSRNIPLNTTNFEVVSSASYEYNEVTRIMNSPFSLDALNVTVDFYWTGGALDDVYAKVQYYNGSSWVNIKSYRADGGVDGGEGTYSYTGLGITDCYGLRAGCLPKYTNYKSAVKFNSIETDNTYMFSRVDANNITMDYSSESDIFISDSFNTELYTNYYGYWATSFQNMYNAINNAGYAQWLTYRNAGYENTADIPSDELIIYPDNLMSNINSLYGVNQSEFYFLYYNMLAQLNNSFLWSGDDDLSSARFNITANFADYMINATLTHNDVEVFNHSLVWCSVLQEDFTIEKGQTYTLTQQVLFYDTESYKFYYGYVGDNLTIHNISYLNSEVDNTTLEITTLQNLLSSMYGIELEDSSDSALTTLLTTAAASATDWLLYAGIGAVIGGVVLYAVDKKKQGLSKIGVLLIVVGIIILLWIYVISPLVSGVLGGVTDAILTLFGKGWLW